MTDPAAKTSALSAEPLTSEEEAKVRDLFARTADRDDGDAWRRWASNLTWIVPLYATRLLATLDAARTESEARIAALDTALAKAAEDVHDYALTDPDVGGEHDSTPWTVCSAETCAANRRALLATTPPTAVEPEPGTARRTLDRFLNDVEYALEDAGGTAIGLEDLRVMAANFVPHNHDIVDGRTWEYCGACGTLPLAASSGPAKEPLVVARLAEALQRSGYREDAAEFAAEVATEYDALSAKEPA